LGKEERAGSCLEPALFNFPGLGGLAGEEVDLLRAEIHWRSQDWKAASQVFARLAEALPGPDETLEPKQSRFVMNRAVALALAGESNRLSALETTHGAVMAGTPFGADFRVLTSVQRARVILQKSLNALPGSMISRPSWTVTGPASRERRTRRRRPPAPDPILWRVGNQGAHY
jgi:hypothetical protein